MENSGFRKSPRLHPIPLNVERFLALLPVAGAKLVRLQGVEHAKNLIHVPANAKVVYRYVPDDVVRIDDERCPLANALVRVKDAKFLRRVPASHRRASETAGPSGRDDAASTPCARTPNPCCLR